MRRNVKDWPLCSDKCLIKSKSGPALGDQSSLDPDRRRTNVHIVKKRDIGKMNVLIASRKERANVQYGRTKLTWPVLHYQ